MLNGRRVLIVEDETLIAMELGDLVVDAGGQVVGDEVAEFHRDQGLVLDDQNPPAVQHHDPRPARPLRRPRRAAARGESGRPTLGPARSNRQALALLDRDAVDVALLDLNLADGDATPAPVSDPADRSASVWISRPPATGLECTGRCGHAARIARGSTPAARRRCRRAGGRAGALEPPGARPARPRRRRRRAAPARPALCGARGARRPGANRVGQPWAAGRTWST
jgi:CheY-like chemotaxis protein